MSFAEYTKSKERNNMENEFNGKTIGRWALVFGLFSILFYFLHDIIGAQHYPGYEWMRQAVSDLTATDAPSCRVLIMPII